MLIVCLQSYVQGLHYAQVQHSTNPPAPPLPVEPVQYATIKKQTDNIETTQTKDKVSPVVMLCAHSVFTILCAGIALCSSTALY